MMNILDKFKKFSTIDKDPDWLCSASPVQQRLYVEAKKQYEEKIASTCEKINFAIDSNVFSKNKERCLRCEYNKFCEVL